MSNLTILLDADIVAFKFACTSEQKVDWEDGEFTVHPNEALGIESVNQYVDQLMSDLKADDLIVCLTHETNFRYEVYPHYKHNRIGSYRPANLKPLKEYLKHSFKSYEKPGLEADDCLGILATHPSLVQGRKVIVTTDKDLRTVPGLHYNPDKDAQIVEQPEAAADYFFYTQVLTGDPTDGYPGCRNVGPKRAEKILNGVFEDGPEATWQAILEAYEAKGFDEDFALSQARVARICRHVDYDFKRKKVKLWTPISCK